MNRLRKIALVGAALLALVGVAAGTTLAADPTPTPGPGWQRGTGGPGTGPMFGPRGSRGPAMMGLGAGPMGDQSIMSVLTEQLGLTTQEIITERQAGKSLAEIAASKGMDEVTLLNTVLDAHKTRLDEQVTAGALTQAQADAVYQSMEARLKENIERTEVGPNRPAGTPGQGMGWGRGAGCWGTAQSTQPAS